MRRGRLQRIYNVDLRLPIPDLEQVIFYDQDVSFKMNASFGFVLRNQETGELRYFHSSLNNERVLEVPHLVRNQEEFQTGLSRIMTDRDALEHLRAQRPNSKWVVHKVTNLTFYVNPIIEHPIGESVNLPPYLKHNKGIIGLENNRKTGRPYTDKLCFFRALALHRGAKVTNIERKAVALFKEYRPGGKSESFPGITLSDLGKASRVFKTNIVVYELDEDKQVGVTIR